MHVGRRTRARVSRVPRVFLIIGSLFTKANKRRELASGIAI
jgi:hypothetical protein